MVTLLWFFQLRIFDDDDDAEDAGMKLTQHPLTKHIVYLRLSSALNSSIFVFILSETLAPSKTYVTLS